MGHRSRRRMRQGNGSGVVDVGYPQSLPKCRRGVALSIASPFTSQQVAAKRPPNRTFRYAGYLVLDTKRASAIIASAGHPQPLYLSRESGVIELRTEKGLPLGLMDSEYSEVEVRLEPGDRVLMYTDGILEATNSKGEEFGISRLEQVLQNPSVSAQSILADVQQFAHGAALADDATAVVLRH